MQIKYNELSPETQGLVDCLEIANTIPVKNVASVEKQIEQELRRTKFVLIGQSKEPNVLLDYINRLHNAKRTLDLYFE